MAIISYIFPNSLFFKETTNPDKMEIKYELFLNGTNWSSAGEIE